MTRPTVNYRLCEKCGHHANCHGTEEEPRRCVPDRMFLMFLSLAYSFIDKEKDSLNIYDCKCTQTQEQVEGRYYLRPSHTITDFEWCKAIFELSRPTDGRKYARRIVRAEDLAKHFKIHPNRIKSKVRRTSHRFLSVPNRRGIAAGDIQLTIKGFELLVNELLDRPDW